MAIVTRGWAFAALLCVGCTAVVDPDDVPARCVILPGAPDPCRVGFRCMGGICVQQIGLTDGAVDACAGECSPGATASCANGDSCGHRVCQDDCTWGPCGPTNECLRIFPGHDEWGEGSNYRCCGSGQWQFCLPDCTWSTDCEGCATCDC